jgi:glucose-6-phosphate 1-dehydrogenase
VGRGPLLAAFRQEARCKPPSGDARIPRAAAADVPHPQARHPHGRRNEIVIDFADPGSITAGFLAKEPGAQMRLGAAEMTFRYADSFRAANALEGYERLLLDAMLGDHSLFTRSDAVQRLWEISAPLLDNPPPIQLYAPGSWGPQPALDRLAAPYRWHLPGAGAL